MTFSFDAIANAILAALWRASWQGALVILLAFGIEFFWQRMPTVARSWMWRLVFVKLVLALVCAATIPLPVLPGRGNADRAAQPIVAESTEVAASVQPNSTAELVATPTVASGRSLWTVGLFSLWALGILVHAGYLGHIGQVIGRQIGHARRTAIADLTLQRLFTSLLPRFGLRRSPRLCISPNIDGPCVYGLNRPTVLIPNSWRETCSNDQLQLVMAHELAHLQRHDLWWNQAIVACRVALFFHPLVWLAAQRYLAAQELACDELALRRTGGSPVNLARLLLKFVDEQPAVTEWANAAAMVGASSTLRERIVAMNRKWLASASTSAVGLVVTAGVLLLVPFTLADQGSTGSPGDPPAKNKPNSTGASASASASAEASGRDPRTQSSAKVQLGLPAPANIEQPRPASSVSESDNPVPPLSSPAKVNPKVKQTVTQNDGNGQGWSRVTEAEEPGRKIKIEETKDEIRVTLLNTVTGNEVVRVAKTAEDLKKQNTTAHGLYRKYVTNPENRNKASAAIGTSPSDSPGIEANSQSPMPGSSGGFAGGSASGSASGSAGGAGNGPGIGFSRSSAQGVVNGAPVGGAAAGGAPGGGNAATDLLRKQLQELKQQNPGQAAMIDKMLQELERQGKPGP